MILSRKIIITAVAFSILGGLFYLFVGRNNKSVVKEDVVAIDGQPGISWRKTIVTMEESTEKIFTQINAPKIVIFGNRELSNEINQVITQRIELLKDSFISGVSTAAYKNGETNTLNIDTEILLLTPHLLSLAFTTTEHFAGSRGNSSEQTFIIFDIEKGEIMREGDELFHDVEAWREAVRTMKASLLSSYQGEPNCDLLFAPKQNGFAASCIGIDRSRGGHISITGDIPISEIEKLLAPSVLSGITSY